MKYWNYGTYVTDKTRPASIITVEGTVKTTLKDIPATTDVYGDLMLSKPVVLVIRLGRPDGGKDFYQYAAG